MITQAPNPRTSSLVADACVMTFLAAFLYGLMQVAHRWGAPLQPQVEIRLNFLALPGYAGLSLLRGFVAYGISLTFTLIYGYIAAHRQKVVAAVENEWDKYRVTMRDIEEARDAAKVRLDTFLRDLGYE